MARSCGRTVPPRSTLGASNAPVGSTRLEDLMTKLVAPVDVTDESAQIACWDPSGATATATE
jgi:hypothetical protein